MDKKIYVAGRPFIQKDGSYLFALAQTYGRPYVTSNPNSGPMRMCGQNGCAMYALDREKSLLVKVSDPHYETKDYGICLPQVHVDRKMMESIDNGIVID